MTAQEAIPSLETISDEKQDDNETIFVSIISYRDSECEKTIHNLFERAKYPDRISIGLYLQINPSCERLEVPSKWKKQIRILEVSWLTAKGPIFARAMAQSLFRGEKYYLQIDSHMRFRTNWDSFLIEQLSRCPGRKPILSTYPLGYNLPDKLPNSIESTILCAQSFGNDGFLRLTGKVLKAKQKSPTSSLFWAAGFSFSSSLVLQEVPYDPHIHYIFFGEEAYMSVRLYTHGWNFFSPSEAVAYHLWSRDYRPLFREAETPLSNLLRKHALKRIEYVLFQNTNLELDDYIEIDKYSLGLERTLDDFEANSGISLRLKTISDRSLWGNLSSSDFKTTF